MLNYNQEDMLNLIDDPSIDVEEEIAEELANNADEPSNRKLYIDKSDKSMADLFRMIREKEINLQPDFQRKFIWDKGTMSRFIESLLLSIPIPTVFLSENSDDTFDVIDGQQRLTTIFAFMSSSLESKDGLPENLKEIQPLILSGLDTLKNLNKTKYDDLGDKKRRFNNVSLPVVIIKKDSSEDIKYDIFSRINRGSIKLNNQELLNVMYRGVLINKINEVANQELVDKAFERRPVLKKRFGYHEIILRVMAMECFIDREKWKLKSVDINNKDLMEKKEKTYNGRLNSSVLDYLKEYRNDSKEAKRLEEFILDTMDKVTIVFGTNSFKRINKTGSTSINKTIAEVQLITLSRFDKELVIKNKEYILNSFNEFLNRNSEDLFTKATNNTKNVEKRYDWGKELSEKLVG